MDTEADNGDDERFGALLRQVRLARSLTQEELAERAGLSVRGLSDLERGINRRARPDTFVRLSHALSLDEKEQAHFERLLHRAPARPPADIALSRPATNHSSPLRLTSFIGREHDILEVRDLVLARRLVTLAGPGGIGKTSLALAVASALTECFVDGVVVVELAAVANDNLVAHAIASAFGISEQPDEPMLNTLSMVVGSSQRLLVLDNCEHLVFGSARVAEWLLQACPHLTILATSREPLRVGPEVVWRVPPLSCPPTGGRVELVKGFEAVRLFVERAAGVRADFVLTDDNAEAVAEIGRRLDGIPLAIELAAAWVEALTPEQIARLLSDRFALLNRGSRTASTRHHTLRALFDWSHDLLTEQEQMLLRRVAVFAGGWTLAAAEAVGAGTELRIEASVHPEEVHHLLRGLVDKSLVLAEERHGHMRFRLLETVREYALNKLAATDEQASTRAAHATYFATWVGGPGPQVIELPGNRLAALPLNAVATEADNLRAALGWFLERGDAEAGLGLAARIYHFWFIRGPREEGRTWLQKLLALPSAGPTHSRASATYAAGHLALVQNDLDEANESFMQAERLAKAREDRSGRALARSRAGVVAFLRGDLARAGSDLKEGARMARDADAPAVLLDSLAHLGIVAVARRDRLAAREVLADARAVLPRFPSMAFRFIWLAGDLALAEGQVDQAGREYRSALSGRMAAGDLTGVAISALGLAAVAAAARDGARAARLLGWSEGVAFRVGGQLITHAEHRSLHRRVHAVARELLGVLSFAAVHAEGQAMTMEQGLVYALTDTVG